MRKLTLELELNEQTREGLRPMFKSIHKAEMLETLKTEWEEGESIILMEFLFKDEYSIDGLKFIGFMEILAILKSDGNKHTCLIKYHAPDISKTLFKEFDLDLITTTPTIMTENTYTCSVIGDQKHVARFKELMETNIGKAINMKWQKAAYQKHDILSVLTDKQKEILITANHYGYYDYPKKINSKQLSEKVNISRATLVEHLRKAESRLLANILAGYSLK
jgi:hypothetical protein